MQDKDRIIGLKVEYSEEVTEEQVRELDNLVRKEFETGDWVTEECDK